MVILHNDDARLALLALVRYRERLTVNTDANTYERCHHGEVTALIDVLRHILNTEQTE